MRLVIEREPSTDSGTFGVGTLGERTWPFIELPWRDNLPERSCVPAGVYPASLVDSPHFRRKVYLLSNVPHRSSVEMHPANWAGDVAKGMHSDLRGCCAPGKDRGMLTPPDTGIPQACVVQSAKALDEILAATGGADIEIEFRWKFANPEGEKP